MLPTDFATDFGYQAATGTETYLPPYVVPRIGTYIAPASLFAVQVVITRPDIFTHPPGEFTLSGNVMTLQSMRGESRIATPLLALQTVVGPQGVPGQDATFTTGQTNLTGSDVTLSTSGLTTVITTPTLAAGTYLVFGKIQCQANTSASTFRAAILGGTATPVAQLPSTAAAQIATLNIYGRITLSSSSTLVMQAGGSAGTPKALVTGSSSGDNTLIFWLKV